MRATIIANLEARFASYLDILRGVSAEDLGSKIDVPKHKNLAEHLWCVVGARESYAKALAQGSWAGFACSMADFTHDEFLQKLDSSAHEVQAALDGITEWTSERDQLLIALSDHEVMHEGQIIRHMYALEMSIPDSVKWA